MGELGFKGVSKQWGELKGGVGYGGSDVRYPVYNTSTCLGKSYCRYDSYN